MVSKGRTVEDAERAGPLRAQRVVHLVGQVALEEGEHAVGPAHDARVGGLADGQIEGQLPAAAGVAHLEGALVEDLLCTRAWSVVLCVRPWGHTAQGGTHDARRCSGGRGNGVWHRSGAEERTGVPGQAGKVEGRTLCELADERLGAHELAAREHLAAAEGVGRDEAVAVKGVADALVAIVEVARAVAQQCALQV